MAVYSASKFALHGFFDSLRQELNIQNINVSISTFVLGKKENNVLILYIVGETLL